MRGRKTFRSSRRTSAASACSQQVKIDLHASAAGHGFPTLRRRTKAPLSDSFDRFLVEAQAGTRDHTQIGSAAGLVHFNGEYHRALKLGLARLFGEFGFDFVDQLWWCSDGCYLSLIHISEPTRLGMISYA